MKAQTAGNLQDPEGADIKSERRSGVDEAQRILKEVDAVMNHAAEQERQDHKKRETGSDRFVRPDQAPGGRPATFPARGLPPKNNPDDPGKTTHCRLGRSPDGLAQPEELPPVHSRASRKRAQQAGPLPESQHCSNTQRSDFRPRSGKPEKAVMIGSAGTLCRTLWEILLCKHAWRQQHDTTM